MKAVAARFFALALVACVSTSARSQDLSGAWTMSIRDLSQKEISTLTIRFSDERGRSCMVGNWKQVIVEAAATSEPEFFPVSDALTYELKDSELVIGRNGVCDSYLQLKGKFEGTTVHGRYFGLGLYGGTDLGEFLLKRSR